jgi:uncharacterized protein YlzI (FlbEa/FlbD family)
MPTQIHLSHGERIVVEEDGGAVLQALNSPAGRLALFNAARGEQVLVNPDHVVYLDAPPDAGPWGAFT